MASGDMVIEGVEASRRVAWAKFYQAEVAGCDLVLRIAIDLHFYDEWAALQAMRRTLQYIATMQVDQPIGGRAVSVAIRRARQSQADLAQAALARIKDVICEQWDQPPADEGEAGCYRPECILPAGHPHPNVHVDRGCP